MKRLLCFLSYHDLKTLEITSGIEVCECQNCNRRWVVWPDSRMVWEVTR